MDTSVVPVSELEKMSKDDQTFKSPRSTIDRVNSASLAEEKDYTKSSDGVQIYRKRTVAENEVLKRKDAAHEFISHLHEHEDKALPQAKPYMPNLLENAIFCGHLVTDLDSIAGAIGAAELYGADLKFCLPHLLTFAQILEIYYRRRSCTRVRSKF